MVFENLTLFEIQLDGADFGARTDARRSDTMPADEPSESSGGRGRLLGLLVFATVMAAAGLYYRRSRSADVELEAEADEADLVEAQ